jgi:two-component system, response regulator YesN
MSRQKDQSAARKSVSAADALTVQRVVDFIEKGYADRITLYSIGAALRGKPQRLSRLFEKSRGMSVHEYVTQVRLDHAARLVSSSVKVEAVALSVGYRSKKDFYRQFIRRFRVTPETYRLRQR